jgi:hypothetical protein
MATTEDLIEKIYKEVMEAVNECFEEIEEYDYEEDDLIPEEKVSVDLFDARIRDAITIAIEELLEDGEIILNE